MMTLSIFQTVHIPPGVLPYKRLMGMGRWTGRIFATGLTIVMLGDVALSIVTRMGSKILGFLG